MKPKFTQCLDCSCIVKQHPRGRLKLRCDDCHPIDKRDWYRRNRQNSKAWIATNKRRARAWRKKNVAHIRAYNAARYQSSKMQAAE